MLRTRPRVAHARIFLCENRTRREKKKFQKNWREREIDFGLRVPVSFKDSLSLFLSSGSGNKNKKHGRVRCVYRVVVFLLRSLLFGSRKIVRSSRGERFRKPKARFLRLLFSFLFSREIGPRKIQKPLQKRGQRNELFKREKKTKENDMRLSNFGVPIFPLSLSLSPSRARARTRALSGDKALTFFIFFFFTFFIITQAEPAVRARGAGGRRREKTRRAELFATLERSPER